MSRQHKLPCEFIDPCDITQWALFHRVNRDRDKWIGYTVKRKFLFVFDRYKNLFSYTYYGIINFAFSRCDLSFLWRSIMRKVPPDSWKIILKKRKKIRWIYKWIYKFFLRLFSNDLCTREFREREITICNIMISCLDVVWRDFDAFYEPDTATKLGKRATFISHSWQSWYNGVVARRSPTAT